MLYEHMKKKKLGVYLDEKNPYKKSPSSKTDLQFPPDRAHDAFVVCALLRTEGVRPSVSVERVGYYSRHRRR